MVQLDSIRVDVAASLDRIGAVYSRHSSLIEEEAVFFKENRIDAVVCDIPAIPLEAAARLGIPRIAAGNFSWDWIYSEFIALDKRWQSVVDAFRKAYAKTDLLLRLPFYGDMSVFPNIEDIPLVASPGREHRDKIADETGCDRNKKWILLSFTSLDWNEEALARVGGIDGCEFFTVLPLAWKRKNIHVLDGKQVTFSDVVASVDAVISKPGFGILSDCMVNRKPLIYAERKNFLEYPILEVAVRKYLRHFHIPAEQLYRGDLRESLDHIGNCPEPQSYPEQGGDLIAAARIADFLD
jgi:L-arabinokinase